MKITDKRKGKPLTTPTTQLNPLLSPKRERGVLAVTVTDLISSICCYEHFEVFNSFVF